ncbi:leucine-rich repeat-containing protein 18-like [Lethenteron reissneri]|uniref:leucine-rich repeat-containing protein 18-like n=1 Tax=Lethenteron reissneri TaxID=7753 RepID=UPI002AB657DC|nr:leucine-rich repeat-containing protein 18-like [Lethenteron reissneri]XP_061421039.1 leucine-rich repeat-containing protein 18-like [Lethenteron reissneri]
MPKKRAPKGRKLTLKQAKAAVHSTPDGKKRLNLSNAGLAIFPKCLLKLSDVDELDLSRNALRVLPPSIGKFVNLRSLDVHSNRLESLPESLGQLSGLLHLNACNNRLVTHRLPEGLAQLQKLRTLNLGLNELDSVPRWLGHLRELTDLGLFDNAIAGLPETVAKLPKLQKLNVKRNPLALAPPETGVVPGGGEPCPEEASLLLVHESEVCKPCLASCQEERARRAGLLKNTNKGSNRGVGRFSGLITPNSVAKETQTAWR